MNMYVDHFLQVALQLQYFMHIRLFLLQLQPVHLELTLHLQVLRRSIRAKLLAPASSFNHCICSLLPLSYCQPQSVRGGISRELRVLPHIQPPWNALRDTCNFKAFWVGGRSLKFPDALELNMSNLASSTDFTSLWPNAETTNSSIVGNCTSTTVFVGCQLSCWKAVVILAWSGCASQCSNNVF